MKYPRCPECGGPVAAAMMTSDSCIVTNSLGVGERYYHPDALSVHCVNGTCTYDVPLADLTTPVPKEERNGFREHLMLTVINEGRRAAMDGQARGSNPYTTKNMSERTVWDAGWIYISGSKAWAADMKEESCPKQ